MLNRLRYGKIVDIIGGGPQEAGCPCCGVFGMDGRDIKDRMMVPARPGAWKKGGGLNIASKNPESKESESLEGKKKEEKAKRSFSIFSYQTTPQLLCSKANFPKSVPSALKWKNRARTLLSEIVLRKADVVCLQGLDENRVLSFWVKRLAQYGYAMIPPPGQQEHRNHTQRDALAPGVPATAGSGKEGQGGDSKAVNSDKNRSSSSDNKKRAGTSSQPAHSHRRSPCRVVSTVFYQRRIFTCDMSFRAHDDRIAGCLLRFKEAGDQDNSNGGGFYGSSSSSSSSSDVSNKSSGGNSHGSRNTNDRQSLKRAVTLTKALMVVSTDLSITKKRNDDGQGAHDDGGERGGTGCQQGKSSPSPLDPVGIVRHFLEEIGEKHGKDITVVVAGDFGTDFEPGSAKYKRFVNSSGGGKNGGKENDGEGGDSLSPVQFLDSYAFRLQNGGFATAFPPESEPSVTDFIFCMQDGRLVVDDVLELQHQKALLESEGALPSPNFGSFHLSLCALIHTSALA